jgi:hypothetical protein
VTRRGGRQPKLAKRKNTAAWSHETEYLYTFGPEVADIAASAGLEPDHNQQWILDQTFGRLRDGRPSAFEVDIIGPRQNLKTATIIMIELGWGFVTEESLVLHTAHELDATEEAFIDLRLRIEETPSLAKYLDPTKGEKDHPGIYTGNGSWEIHLLGGIRFKYKARRKDAGRALTADKVVLDEFFAVEPSMVGSLYPTLTTIPDAQVVAASSAGKLYSQVLRDHRKRGRAGTSPRQFYAEFGDPNAWTGCKSKTCDHALTAIGCALDDEKRWARIMPAWGLRVFPETIRSMRQAMPPLEFAREFMVWWEDPPNEDDGGAIDLTKWVRLGNPASRKPASAAVYLDVAPDRRKASIGVAGSGTSKPYLVMVRTDAGHDWVVPALKKMRANQAITEVALHPQSQAAVLIPQLVEEGIPYTAVTTADRGRETAGFIEKVLAEHVEHVGQPELDAAVRNAITKVNASGEVEVWDRRDRTVDITAVVAAAGALDRWCLQPDYDVTDSFL